MNMPFKPVLVGEMNPYHGPPGNDLACWPVGSSGWRLQSKIMDVSRATYVGFERHNLCVGTYNAKAARAESTRLILQYPLQEGWRHVLFGAKVTTAYGRDFVPFTVQHEALVLPHPSGLSRAWNEPGAFERARGLLREHFPEVSWGRGEPPAGPPTCANCNEETVGGVCPDCGPVR